jgi:hypothetical protein
MFIPPCYFTAEYEALPLLFIIYQSMLIILFSFYCFSNKKARETLSSRTFL